MPTRAGNTFLKYVIPSHARKKNILRIPQEKCTSILKRNFEVQKLKRKASFAEYKTLFMLWKNGSQSVFQRRVITYSNFHSHWDGRMAEHTPQIL